MAEKVRDIMVPLEEAAVLPAKKPVKEALAALLKIRRGYRLLVVKERNRAVGLVGPREIMRALAPEGHRVLTIRGWTVTLECNWLENILMRESVAERLEELADKPVKEIMAHLREELRVDDDIGKAARVLARSDREALPVWQGNRLVGLVGPKEILRALAEKMSLSTGAVSGKVIYLEEFQRKKEVTTNIG